MNLCLSAMVELDGDDIRISSRGKLAERDIVQVILSHCTGSIPPLQHFCKTLLDLFWSPLAGSKSRIFLLKLISFALLPRGAKAKD